MRWTRPLLLLAILLIVAGVGTTFYARLKEQNANTIAKPKALPDGLVATSQGWSYTQTDKGKPTAYVHADDFAESGGKFHLTGVELHLFHKDSTEYDKIQSAQADFDEDKGILFSDGDVEITMGVPVDEEPSDRLMKIKSSGVTFETKTGKATTDRLATFEFDRGNGRAVGAGYDPQTHELELHGQVQLNWHGTDPTSKPMHVEAGNAVYKEKESKVYLGGWSKLVRDTLTLNAGPAAVTLSDGVIQLVETVNANGIDNRPNRKIQYGADTLVMHMDDSGQIQQITGEQKARLDSQTDAGQTTITADRVDLDFDTSDSDSVLRTALARGHSVAESKPTVKPGADPADTRVLRSEVITTKMRPGGQEIDTVETATAGSLEFIPNRPSQPHRWLNGDKLWIQYGAKNQIQSCRSVNVTTKTLKPRTKDAKEDPPPALTTSKELLAEFDPKTSQLSKLQQWNSFSYEEGLRKAKANRALLEQDKNIIHLTGSARVWDNTGSTDADVIVLDQKSGDFSAEGNVNSTRLPDKKKDSDDSGSLLSPDEPMHAKAAKMISRDNNLQIRYEGNAVAWQTSNRLQADVIEIDRDNNILKAHGNVISQLLDKANNPDKKPGEQAAKKKDLNAPPVFTIVRAPDLIYNDDDRLAVYKGGVILKRPSMTVKSQELKAYLRDTDDDSDSSSLDHAFADGKVEIVQTALDRTRTGTAEHAEYYVDEAKVILETGHPQLVDTIKGSTKGKKLTWFSDDDRLLVDGAVGAPAQSKLRRK